jgi:hypothetical protein
MGCSIAVHYHSNSESAGKLVEELRNMKVKAESFKADLTKYEEVGRCVLFSGERWVREVTSLGVKVFCSSGSEPRVL